MNNAAFDGIDFDSLVEEARVRREIYTDPTVFDAEIERIFGRTWVYVGHESEVAAPGDYKTTTVGTEPVILVRDQEGKLHLLVNRCRHRGTSVCQREKGNALYFRCAYHGWTYEADGRLIGMPYASAYDASFRREAMGLCQVPRLGSYRGFIWASLAADGPALDEHLGLAREYLDQYCDASPLGEIALAADSQRYGYDGNWKLQMENAVDGYHPNFVHQSFATIMLRVFGDRLKADFTAAFSDASPAASRALENGHGVLDMRVYAPFTADERNGGGFNISIFPNLILIGSQVRRVRPIAWNRTEVTVQPVVLKGLEHLTESRLRTHESFYGPAGLGQPDDAEMFRRVAEGLRAKSVEWIDFSRGLGRERIEPGMRVGQVTDEVPQRGFYRMWKRLMTARVTVPSFEVRARGAG